MVYDLEDIRDSLNETTGIYDVYQEDFVNFELLLEAYRNDIAIENKITDAISSGVNSFKKFMATVTGWLKSLTGRMSKKALKMRKRLDGVKKNVLDVLKSVKFRAKGSATEDVDDTGAEHAYEFVEIINKFISIAMAQDVLGWKMMSIGIFKGQRSPKLGWTLYVISMAALVFLCLPAFIVVAAFTPVCLALLNNDTNVMLEHALDEELSGIVKAGVIRNKLIKRIKPYRKRLNRTFRSNDDTSQVVNEVLAITDWININDLSYSTTRDLEKVNNANLKKKVDTFTKDMTLKLRGLADAQPTSDTHWREPELMSNMDTVSTIAKSTYQMAEVINKEISKVESKLNQPNFRDWKAALVLEAQRRAASAPVIVWISN